MVEKDGATDPEPSLTVFGGDGLAIADPVSVPAPNGSRIVDADGIDAVQSLVSHLRLPLLRRHQEALVIGTHLLTSNPAPSRLRTVGSTAAWRHRHHGRCTLFRNRPQIKSSYCHALSQARQLHVHRAVVLEHVVALAEEAGELADANVLAHLQLGDAGRTWSWGCRGSPCRGSGSGPQRCPRAGAHRCPKQSGAARSSRRWPWLRSSDCANRIRCPSHSRYPAGCAPSLSPSFSHTIAILLSCSSSRVSSRVVSEMTPLVYTMRGPRNQA